MKTAGKWYYSTNAGQTAALIVDGDGFTVFEMRNHLNDGARFEALAKDVCQTHNVKAPLLIEAREVLDKLRTEMRLLGLAIWADNLSALLAKLDAED